MCMITHYERDTEMNDDFKGAKGGQNVNIV